MPFGTDQILWYNNAPWGALGYAVPNTGDNPTSLNAGVRYLVEVIGRNLAGVMRSPDAELRCPPRIATITRIHKLIIRARTILSGRAVKSNESMLEAVHSTPAAQDHLIYPVPYFLVRNGWIREYCGLILTCISEAAQHTDNIQSYDISVEFSGVIGQLLHRVYRLMAMELLQIPAERAMKLDFTLTDADLATYDPSKWFTATEMIDTIPTPTEIPTEDDLKVLTNGIPATLLTNCVPWPAGNRLTGGGTPSSSSGASSGGSFAPPLNP